MDLSPADIPPSLSTDAVEIAAFGGITLEKNSQGWNDLTPTELLGGGHHFDDVDRNQRPCARRKGGKTTTPRDDLLNLVVAQGLKRPVPMQWKEGSSNSKQLK